MRRSVWWVVAFAVVALAAWYWQRAPLALSGPAGPGASNTAAADAVVRAPPDPVLAGPEPVEDAVSDATSLASTSTPAAHASQRGRTSIEASVLGAGTMRADVASALLQREDFDAVLRQLRSDSAGSALAADNARRYGEQTAAALAKRFPELALDGFACADSLCGLEARSRRRADDRVFQAILESGSAQAPFFSVVSDTVALPGGGVAYRMLFTTDPARNAIVVPPPPPKR